MDELVRVLNLTRNQPVKHTFYIIQERCCQVFVVYL